VSAAPARHRGIAVPLIFAIAACGLFIVLGAWQIERKAWKEGLIADLSERLAADPQPLPPSTRWASLDPAKDEFRRVVVTGTIAPDQEALVFAAASSFRTDVSGIGYWVFAPVHLAGGATVLVNRGFVPDGQRDPTTHAPFAGALRMVGVLRWPDALGWFAPKDDPARNLWFVRDPAAIAAAKDWGAVAPFYIELETPTSGTGTPHAGRLTPTLRNDHLQYALTWFGLAAIVAIGFPLWLRSRRREAIARGA
jgi:surfeit locus 1 family protein